MDAHATGLAAANQLEAENQNRMDLHMATGQPQSQDQMDSHVQAETHFANFEETPNQKIEVEIPGESFGQPPERVIISMPLKRPASDGTLDSATKAKRRDFQYLSLAAKKALCEYKRDRPKASQHEMKAYLEREFDVKRVPSSTLSTILANADKYLQLDDSQATTGRVKLRAGNHQKMEQVLFSWYKKARAEKIPITDAQIVAVARKIGERLNVPDSFAYSYNWLSGFKIRMGIISRASVTGRKIKSKVAGVKRNWSSALESSPYSGATSPAATASGAGYFVGDGFVVNSIKTEPPEFDPDDLSSQVQIYSAPPSTAQEEQGNSYTIEFYNNYMHNVAKRKREADEDDNDDDNGAAAEESGLEMNCEAGFSPGDVLGLVPHPAARVLLATSTAAKPSVPPIVSQMVQEAVANTLASAPPVVESQGNFKRPRTSGKYRYTWLVETRLTALCSVSPASLMVGSSNWKRKGNVVFMSNFTVPSPSLDWVTVLSQYCCVRLE